MPSSFFPQVQVVAYLHEWDPDVPVPHVVETTSSSSTSTATYKKRAGEFVFWNGVGTEEDPSGRLGVAEKPVPLAGSAVDGTKTVHAARIYRPHDSPPPLDKDIPARLIFHPNSEMETEVEAEVVEVGASGEVVSETSENKKEDKKESRWEVVVDDPAKAATPTSLRNYTESDLRTSIVYRARCFSHETEAKKYTDDLARRASGSGFDASLDLSLEEVLREFAQDLKRKGRLPASIQKLQQQGKAEAGAGAAAATMTLPENDPAASLDLAMAILDTYIKYPFPLESKGTGPFYIPLNYCALPRLVPWTAKLLRPLCGDAA
jgi:hypothetical protein